jgi:C1A family cysteine protease
MHMFKQPGVLAVVTLTFGLACTAGFVGCQTGSSGRPIGNENANSSANDNENVNVNVNADVDVNSHATGLEFNPNYTDLPRAINPNAANAGATLPATADLTGSLPPIGQQGRLGSCTAWASGYAAATYSANRQFQWGADTEAHQASPGYLYRKLLEADAAEGLVCGDGTSIATAMNLLVEDGCSSLAVVGYTDQQCLEALEGDAANFQIGSFKRVTPTDRNAVKAELAAGNVVVLAAKLHEAFMGWNSGDVYYGSGNLLTGGHALACVGYDDTRGAYRIMNSWGTGWGDAGFMWMAYETFEATIVEAYVVLGTGKDEPPPPPPPTETDPMGYLDDAFQFEDQDALSGEYVVYLVFNYHFDAPVLIHTVTVFDPSGDSGQQTYETWFSKGYVAFAKTGGFQWTAGTYGLHFETTTSLGHDIAYEGYVSVEPIGGVAEDGPCFDACYYSFNGICDDGGPGALTAECYYGLDCYDCGPRAALAKTAEVTHLFRGIPVEAKPDAPNFPAAGLREGDLGENGKPLVITRAAQP